MPSNFTFLRSPFPQLFDPAAQAERLIFTAPRASCFYARFALEQLVHWLYANDPYLQLPHDTNLAALIHEPTFKDNLKPGLFDKIRIIHKVGNTAVHDANIITDRDALRLTEELFHITYWLTRFYSKNGNTLPTLNFDRSQIPQTHPPEPSPTQPQLIALEQSLTQANTLRQLAETRLQQTETELIAAKADRDKLLAQNTTIPDTHNYNETDTRRYLIDPLLKEAGWNPTAPNTIEFPVQGMPIQKPNDSGNGFVDYVLWGDNGKPLALIEAKRTSKSPESGQHQAKLYADCLEQRYQQRPIIFYSNGYESFLWDDRAYPPRQIQGFLKKDELERIIFRRTHRKRLSSLTIDEKIAGHDRPYQKESIRRITESFEDDRQRKTLLVMATGTGKTRTAIALVDLLNRANWAHRILFLADRTALLNQAYRAFQTHLPSLTPINLTHTKDISGANVILSTYKTMLNAIDRKNSNSDQRLFGVGHFDLIIIDEAHRSIYKKYGEIFNYFDALLIGLTATPREEIDRDTYRIFELQQGTPTFAYELDDAIKDRNLVPPKGVTIPFKFLRTGVKYSNLSPAEQTEYEEKFRDEDTGEMPTTINAAALNQWLFNVNTVDQALEQLMQRGLKVNSGDRLGKTILFARNHAHAEFIRDRFNLNYPHYNGHFAKIIDSHDNYAQSLLDDFSEINKDPIIAISVDMLDTGVDVPEVVNLVFFKPVFSRVKFNQMIGRGTRLCKDLFSPDQHKTEFLVFDLCGNFEYFEQDIDETEQKLPETLTTRLIKHRLELATRLTIAPDLELDPIASTKAQSTKAQKVGEKPGNYSLNSRSLLLTSLLDDLHGHVSTMPRNNFLVRRRLQQVEIFSDRDRWNSLNENDISTISDTLASLPNGLPPSAPLAKEFDLLCLKLQLAILKNSPSYERLRDRVRDILSQLETKPDHPIIKVHLDLIQSAQEESWWTDITLPMVEEIRVKIRDLTTFIDRTQQKTVITDFSDEMGEIQEVDVPTLQTGFSPYQYRKKVEAYIRAQADHITIAKLKRNHPLTDADLTALEEMLFTAEAIESRDRFEIVFGKTKSLKRLIREMVGLDRSAAKQAFAHYLEGLNLTANQIRFVENIIDYLTQNGIMDPAMLYEAPYTDTHNEGLDGIFNDTEANNIISIIRSINSLVDVDFSRQDATA